MFTQKHEEWATRQKPLMNFIKSITTPPVYYKPKIWSAKTELLLKESQQKHQGIFLQKLLFPNF